MPDESTRKPAIDTSINLGTLLTAGVLFGTILIGWTVTRERVRQNTEETAQLSQQFEAALAEIGRVNNRLLTMENAMAYRADMVTDMNAKLDRLMLAIEPPRPSMVPDR